MSKKIGYVISGKYMQIISFYDFASYMDDMIHVRDLSNIDLSQYAALIIPDAWFCYRDMEPCTEYFNKYLENGGFLIVFDGMQAHKWIRGVKLEWIKQPSKDWLWWTKPQRYIEVYQPEPKHDLCETMRLEDMSWHWSGVYALHPQAISALNLDNDAGSLFLDFENLSCGGRLIVSSLDPHNHNAARYMPATTAFLSKFYPWLNKEVGRFPTKSVKSLKVTCLAGARIPVMQNTLQDTNIKLSFQDGDDITLNTFKESDLLYIPEYYDQCYFKEKQQWFLDYLKKGGQIVLNTYTAISWLPFLKPFKAVPPRPYTNLKVRFRNDPYGFFKGMEEGFDSWEGIHGMYAAGYSEMPENALWLTDIGAMDDPKPCDWLWQYPTIDGKGGKIFVHNGGDMCIYPDHGDFKGQLGKNIIQGMLNNRHKTINPYTRHPHPPFHNLNTAYE